MTAGISLNQVNLCRGSLERILREYLQGRHLELRLQRDPGLTLLFPSSETGGRIRCDIRKMIDRVAGRAGLPAGIYRATALRKTSASARLQTLDNGAPVAPRTVQGELGHRSGDMIEAVYGRLGTVRHRSDVVEYRLAPNSDSAERSAGQAGFDAYGRVSNDVEATH